MGTDREPSSNSCLLFLAAGFKVDIYIATYACSGLAHVSDHDAAQYYNELVSWYGPNVVAHRLIQRKPGQTQDTGTQATAQLLLDNAPLNYHSVIVWRFDMPAILPLKISGLMDPNLPEPSWVDWEHYAERSAWMFFWFDGECQHQPNSVKSISLIVHRYD